MRKAVIAAMAAAIALAPISLTAPVAHAGPSCEEFSDIPGFVESCERLEATCQQVRSLPQTGEAAYENCEQGKRQAMQQARDEEQQRRRPQPTSTVNAPTTHVQTPGSTQGPAKAATVRPPRGLGASSGAIAAARANPAPADPASPPRPPTQKDFSQRVQEAVKSHSGNLDVDNGKVRPRHWDYVDHDAGGHPVIYNPMSEGMTFRYYYQGSYQEAYVEAGTSVSFNFSANDSGVFPFTAVGDTYLTSGSFYTGTPTPTYQNVSVYLPAYGRTVQVDQVQPLGHDDSQPAGSQDTFMLDDSTLAWGQATNPSDGGAITVAKTQSLPNVGPTDDGKSLIDLTAASQPQSNKAPWLIGTLVVVVVMIAAALVTWMVIRRKRIADL